MATAATPVPSVRYKGTQPTHQTSNLPGYPAVDIMVPVDTPVVAAEDGFVYRLGSAIGGLAFYLKGARTGSDYWYGHLASYTGPLRAVSSSNPVRVRQGQILGYVGPHPSGSHLHFGVHGGNAAVIASTPQPTPGTSGTGFFDVKTGEELKPQELGAATPLAGAAGIAVRYGGRVFRKLIPTSKKGKAAVGAGAVLGAEAVGIDIPLVGNPLGWLADNWDRVLEVLAGFVLLIVGLILLGRAMGVAGARRVGGDLANRLEYGPTVVQAAPATRTVRVHEVTDAGERAAAWKARGAQTSEIPF